MIFGGVPFSAATVSLSTAATGNSSAVLISGTGPLRVRVSIPDTSSADGDVSLLFSDAEGGSYVTRTAADTGDVAVLAKNAGTALDDELLVGKPAASWLKIRYEKTSGGAAGELSASIESW